MENSNNQQKDASPKSYGFELLEGIIESNQKVLESNVKVQLENESVVTLLDEIISNLGTVEFAHRNLLKLFDLEEKERRNFLVKIPKTISADLSKESVEAIRTLENKLKALKRVFLYFLGTIVFSLIITIFSIKFAIDFYNTSIKSKSELREEILNEIKDRQMDIYSVEYIHELKENTRMMKLFIKENPKSGKELVTFEKGFKAEKNK